MKLLANEIILEILLHFSVPDEFAELTTLSQLCRSSKRLQRLAQPILYRYIPDLNPEKRQLLFRTLLERPDLAQMVQFWDLQDCGIPRPELLSLVEAVRSKLRLSESMERKLVSDMQEEKEDLEVSLVLLLLPNLQVMEISCYYGPDNLKVGLVKEVKADQNRPCGHVHHLMHLQEVRIRHGDTELCTRLEPAGLLALPSVHSLRGWAVCWQDGEEKAEDEYPGVTLNLRHIDLSWSLCDSRALSRMLSRCPDLQSLQIDWGDATVGADDLDFCAFGTALRKYGRKLEKLDLDCRMAFCYEEGEATGRIGSLRKLVNLKDLALPQDILVGRVDDDNDNSDDDTESTASHSRILRLEEVLPTALEEVHFYSCQDDEKHLDDQILDIITSSKTKNLRRVTMEARESNFHHDVSGFGWSTWRRKNKVFVATKREFQRVPEKPSRSSFC
ncbi:hypothetical protein JX265_011193 [Neoarthrinium moseri]|uniref:F-box domain-containing protein n=1 Tax=Neoarthrinium moseri TaxID=1658444 RepID=A0A9Q0AKY8_9PEZI|nr:uncharacterized protein JN550_010497 [Neoarthrinium moseri]KAI1857458.1 hypothetical protein JX265_011193 [Neoarthrinium moseri]KAI1862032.1 hypothetical protein JN550_010497 [Neoarthrinium moseri]